MDTELTTLLIVAWVLVGFIGAGIAAAIVPQGKLMISDYVGVGIMYAIVLAIALWSIWPVMAGAVLLR